MWNWILKLEELRTEGKPVAVVTVTQCSGSTPRETGAKMLVLPNGEFFGTIGGGHLEQLAIEDAKKSFVNKISQVIKYPLGAKTGQCCGGVVELLFEVINSGPRLYLFGAGHVGQAVCRTLIGTPFVVHVIDERAEWIESPALPKEVIRHHAQWDEVLAEADWDSQNNYAAVMTHRHDMDQDIIAALIKRPTRYIGLIGSRAKWERFKQRLTARGVLASDLEKVRCPIGIALGGGKAPQEIAVSVAAELIRIHYEGAWNENL